MMESFTNCIGIEMIHIPAGVLFAGSPATEKTRRSNEGPVHPVEMKPFYISKAPITQEQYSTICCINPSFFSADGGGGQMVSGLDTRNHPIESVSWEEAVLFCRRLSTIDSSPHNSYRLPTEYEWEYACRSNTRTPFSGGSTFSAQDANISHLYPFGCTYAGKSFGRTIPVCSYAPNLFGLYDMHGNVWEWCANAFFDYSKPDQVLYPTSRVTRGGSWNCYSRFCRSSYRNICEINVRYYDTGFRIVSY